MQQRLAVMAAVLALGLMAPSAWSQATAAFSADPPAGAAALTVQFHNDSSADTHTWLWSFGDGGSSSVFEPTHVFETPGSYTVNLLAIGSGSAWASAVVQALPPVLDPQFEVAPSTGVVPLEVTFSHTASDDTAAWLWDFGDGTTSTAQAPTHVYWAAGEYDISLTVSAAGSSASATQPAAVQVQPPVLMQPGLEATPSLGLAPLEVTFRYTGQGAEPETFLWDFGDGATSSERHPVHTFTEPGSQDVSLTTSLGGVVEGLAVADVATVEVADVAFDQPVVVASPTLVTLLGAADVSGDGLPDIVSVRDDIVAFLGAGDGSLSAPVITTVPGEPVAAGVSVLGDLDVDGVADIVTLVDAGGGGHRLEPWLAAGGGAFVPGTVFPLGWPAPGTTRLALGDVLGDGALDLVATHQFVLSVLPGDGRGGLLPPAPAQTTVLAGEGQHTGLSLVDLDLDGDLDLHARYSAYAGTHWVAYENHGAGRFEASCGGSGGSHSAMGSSQVAELDGDGYPDIVTSWQLDYCTGSSDPLGPLPLDITSWATGCPGSGLCTNATSVDAGELLVLVADVDGHAADDLFVFSAAGGLSVRPSTGSFAFAASVPLPEIPAPRLAVDLDGDGRRDLVGVLPSGGLWTARNLTPTPGWFDVGGGLAGGGGLPGLLGTGLAAAGLPVQLALTGAAPASPAWLAVGLSALQTPFQGGVLVPAPDVVVPFATDGQGQALLAGAWPGALGPGSTTWWQAWVADPSAPAGLAASNALRHVVPEGGG